MAIRNPIIKQFSMEWDGTLADLYDWRDSLDDHVGSEEDVKEAEEHFQQLINSFI